MKRILPAILQALTNMTDEGYVQSYIVENEILNVFLREMPIGKTHYLKQQHGNRFIPTLGDMINNHSMDAVIRAIEKEEFI